MGQTLKRFAASGLNWPEAAGMDDAALEAALYPARQVRPADEDVDWAEVEKDLSGRGVTLKLLWEEWRETHPAGMSYVTWSRRFRDWRPGGEVTMRQNRPHFHIRVRARSKRPPVVSAGRVIRESDGRAAICAQEIPR